MYKFMNTKLAKELAFFVVGCFCGIHILMFLLFRHFGVVPMMYFNVGSILFYLFSFWVVHKGMFHWYAASMYVEVVLHMFLAIVFTGWESGFETTLIGISTLLFYSEYVCRYLKKPYVPSFPLCLLGPLAYIVSYIWINQHPPKYMLPVSASFGFQLFWASVVFSITISVLYIFVKISLKSEEYLENEVGHDQLTGLPNRYYFADSLSNLDFPDKATDKDCSLSHSPATSHCAGGSKWNGYWAAIIDIDDFKKINDTYGHNYGDYVLKELAGILLEWRDECGADTEIGSLNTRQGKHARDKISMTIGRWGGEEFLIVGRGGEDLYGMLDKLRIGIRDYDFKPFIGSNFSIPSVHVTVTIGLAEYVPGMSVREWIGIADSRLYEGKASGKNKVVA